ncbi:MAG TPA: ABC transporter ATP-binding protein [Thermoanaerobaculia bacterium]|nr:ABC transporter ATP-binding protein [Thermoanaerobaculia bacterium]
MTEPESPPERADILRGALEVVEVEKAYHTAHHQVRVLAGVSFGLGAGEALCLTGPSGSGKSTLLHVIGGLEPPTAGHVALDGRDPYRLSEPELARFRNSEIGFVFQDHHLLPQYDVLRNVLLPALASVGRLHRAERAALEDRARGLLAAVGLAQRAGHRPAQLSGGERQRAAIARALINRPSVLLCDEPTGNLDHGTAEKVADLLFELHRAEGTSLVVVTHARELAFRFRRRLDLVDGKCAQV